MKYPDKTALVYDHGVFVEIAATLAKDFGRVLYYAPWETGYPESNALMVGAGIAGVTRVPSIWPHLNEIDLFVFPDVYDGALQVHLASLGKRVWGARMGEELELDREASKQHCVACGIPIGTYRIVNGLDALRDYLRTAKDKYVKVSSTRGDMETFHVKNYALAEPRLDELEHRHGPKKNLMEFIVEDAIRPAVEAGYDGYTIDGRFPKQALYGIEIKDKAYLGRVKPYAALPEPVRSANDKLRMTFASYRYRGFWSSEIRVTPDGKGYMIDPCCRCGSPPSELYQVMIRNLAEVMWEGAAGNLVEPDFIAPYGAMALICSEWALKNWQAVEFPRLYRNQVKLRNLTVIDGRHYYVPDKGDCSVIGAVVGVGKTRAEAIADCRKVAEKVEGFYIDIETDALDEASSELDKIEAVGKKEVV